MNYKILILLFGFFKASLFGQYSEQISEKNSELGAIRSEISSLENELSKLSEKEKLNLSVLKKIDKQNLLLGRSIKNLEIEERSKEEQIQEIEVKVSDLQKKIEKLQEQYGDYLVWLYKQGDNSTLKYVFNSESFNQALVRFKHLQYVHDQSEETLTNLKTTKQEFDSLVSQLAEELEEKIRVINQKSEEKRLLLASRNERNNILKELK